MPSAPIDLRKIRHELKGPDKEPGAPAPSESSRPKEPEVFSGQELPRLENALIEWESWEFETFPGRTKILMFLGGILFAGAVIALFFKNILFASLLIIAGLAVVVTALRSSRRVRFAITSRGLVISERLFEFKTLKSFWIFYEPPFTKDISFVSQRTFMPTIRVPLGDLDPVRVRKILLKFIPEAEHEESLADIIAKRLGF